MAERDVLVYNPQMLLCEAALRYVARDGATGGRLQGAGCVSARVAHSGSTRLTALSMVEGPQGVLKNGQNTLTIRNLGDADSVNAAWFMVSQAKVMWK